MKLFLDGGAKIQSSDLQDFQRLPHLRRQHQLLGLPLVEALIKAWAAHGGSIPGTVPTIAPGFEGCAFRSRCPHADETCAHDIPRRRASAAHDYLCRLAPAEAAESQPA